MLIEQIDGLLPAAHVLTRYLAEAGFTSGALGMQAILRSHQPSVVRHESPVAGRQSPSSGRPPKSTVSSPFARRYFEATDTVDATEPADGTDETIAPDKSDR
jgi:hypothetical protein